MTIDAAAIDRAAALLRDTGAHDDDQAPSPEAAMGSGASPETAAGRDPAPAKTKRGGARS
jgi:hypothetical protein